MENLRQSIMESVINQFNQKGMKFTMDDISKKLHISKKTIYKEFDDKDELFYATVDYGFAAIKQKESEKGELWVAVPRLTLDILLP